LNLNSVIVTLTRVVVALRTDVAAVAGPATMLLSTAAARNETTKADRRDPVLSWLRCM
jgi:hypothetical protein